MLHGDGSGALLIGDEAVCKLPAVLLTGIVCAEVQSIKKGLDADLAKTIFSLYKFADILYGIVQKGKAFAHLLDVGTVHFRRISWDCTAVKA